MKFKPHTYQQRAIDHLHEHPYAGLFMEMGLGKTICVLTAMTIQPRLKTLVVAPLRVAEEVWAEEAVKWDHTKYLVVSKILGTVKQRVAALEQTADLYVINRENVVWLVQHLGKRWDFERLVIDELSSFKSAKAQRFKALRQVRPRLKQVIGLTGTPAPNSLLDLWPELYLLDQGRRLGRYLTEYRERYFTPAERQGHIVYSWNLRQGDELLGKDIYEREIYEKIQDICISMRQEDYLTLPGRVENDIRVKIDLAGYEKFERDQVMTLEGQVITAVNAAALVNKLLQYANGAVYDEQGTWHEVHTAKLDALGEILEASHGQPVFIFYAYKHDKARIMARFPQVEDLDVKRWNEGRCVAMTAHPGSAGHGLNLQAGGHLVVWFGLPSWSLELEQQANKRFDRQGQTEVVVINRLVAVGTQDEQMIKILAKKDLGQARLLDAVKDLVKKYF
jgi:SNF2 family DNA or RNA helicase